MDKIYIYTLAILLALIVYNFLGTIIMALLVRVFGVELRELSLGVGPKLFGFMLGQSHIKISAVPFSSYMKVTDNRHEEISGDPDKSFDRLNPIIRFLIVMIGFLTPLIPALILFPQEIINRGFTAVIQLFHGAVSPFGMAHELLDRGFMISASHGLFFAIAIILFKIMVFYLIPVTPNFGSGQAIVAMSPNVRSKGMLIWQNLSALICILLSLSWGVAIISYPFFSK